MEYGKTQGDFLVDHKYTFEVGKAYKTFKLIVSTQFRASPFERALFSALNRVLLIN